MILMNIQEDTSYIEYHERSPLLELLIANYPGIVEESNGY